MTFPRSEGQVPIYYARGNSGRPPEAGPNNGYVSGYIDLPFTPLYPFGHGLSYTTFGYDQLQLDRRELHGEERLVASVRITNTGTRAGAEVVQLYLHQRVASVEPPVAQLRGFERVVLQPGESRTVRFTIDREALSFQDAQARWVAEPGEFDLMVGSSVADIRVRDHFALRD